jgi:H+/Cl- antiporter ClcA
LQEGAVLSLSNAAALKFGNIDIVYSPLTDLPAGIFIGVVCGCLGSVFIFVYSNLGVWRKKNINTNTKKLLEVAFVSMLTTSSFFWLSALSARNPEHCLP